MLTDRNKLRGLIKLYESLLLSKYSNRIDKLAFCDCSFLISASLHTWSIIISMYIFVILGRLGDHLYLCLA